MHEYDIVIIGGGFVGASALLGLSRLAPSLKVALLDAADPLKAEGGERSIVLSYASQRILSQWGCWDELREGSTPLMAVHISQAGRFGRTLIQADQLGVPALGYVVPADQLAGFLKTNLQATHYFYRTACTHLERKGDGFQLEVQQRGQKEGEKTHWKAKLVLVADGAYSKLRALMGIPVKEVQYTQQAIVGQVNVTHPNQTGYERFMGEEALAMVPRGGNTYGVIWKVGVQRSHTLMHLSASEFLAALNAAFGHRLGHLFDLGIRKSYPLRFIRALKETLPGLVLLGDAAHANPPMAAQGLNLSLRDIAVLVSSIEAALRTGQDFASATFLQQYENARLADQARITSLVNFPMSRTFRNIPDTLKGLAWLGVDLCDGMKRNFAHTMMGI